MLVKGGDYRVDQIAGHEAVLAHGGDVVIVPLKPNRFQFLKSSKKC